MKREPKVPENAEVFFTLIKPTPNKEGPNSRRSFSFIMDIRFADGRRDQPRYKFPDGVNRLKVINKAYKIADDKNEAFEKCLKLALDLQKKLYIEHGLEEKTVFNQENYGVLDEFSSGNTARRNRKTRLQRTMIFAARSMLSVRFRCKPQQNQKSKRLSPPPKIISNGELRAA